MEPHDAPERAVRFWFYTAGFLVYVASFSGSLVLASFPVVPGRSANEYARTTLYCRYVRLMHTRGTDRSGPGEVRVGRPVRTHNERTADTGHVRNRPNSRRTDGAIAALFVVLPVVLSFRQW